MNRISICVIIIDSSPIFSKNNITIWFRITMKWQYKS